MTLSLPDLTGEPAALRLLKRPIEVPVTFAAEDDMCETLEGTVRYRAGDALLTGRHGERWPVQRELFNAAYEPVMPTLTGSNGLYRKRPTVVLAVRLSEPLVVPVGWQADPLHGQAGDWLLRYEDGSHSVVQDSILRDTYGPAPGETRWTSEA